MKTTSMEPKRSIHPNCSALLLCEGKDAERFLIYLLDHMIKKDPLFESVQVWDFGGIKDLSKGLRALQTLDNYQKISTLIILRDAETDYAAALASIQQSLQEAQLPVPSKAYQKAGTNFHVGYALFPGTEDTNGTLEDLCLEILSEQEAPVILKDIDSFIDVLKERRARKFPHRHKSRLHCYFSISDDYVSMKIGEAAKAGAFDFCHEKLQPLKNFLREMLS